MYTQLSFPIGLHQVDIALECARMQHRFSLPPLEVQDFSQAGLTDFNLLQSGSSHGINSNETDCLQEILSVAQASQQLINQSSMPDMRGGIYAYEANDFTFPTANETHHNQMNNSMRSLRSSIGTPWEDMINTRSIEIGEPNEEFGDGRMVENLRWVGMSYKDLEKVAYLTGRPYFTRPFFNYEQLVAYSE